MINLTNNDPLRSPVTRRLFPVVPAPDTPSHAFLVESAPIGARRARSGWGRDARSRHPPPPPLRQSSWMMRSTRGRQGYWTRRQRAPPRRRRETRRPPKPRRGGPATREAEKARPSRWTKITTARTTKCVVYCGTRGTSTTTSSSRRCAASGAAAADTGRRSAPDRRRSARAICAATSTTSPATVRAGFASTASGRGTGAGTATSPEVSASDISHCGVCGAASEATPCPRAAPPSRRGTWKR